MHELIRICRMTRPVHEPMGMLVFSLEMTVGLLRRRMAPCLYTARRSWSIIRDNTVHFFSSDSKAQIICYSLFAHAYLSNRQEFIPGRLPVHCRSYTPFTHTPTYRQFQVSRHPNVQRKIPAVSTGTCKHRIRDSSNSPRKRS